MSWICFEIYNIFCSVSFYRRMNRVGRVLGLVNPPPLPLFCKSTKTDLKYRDWQFGLRNTFKLPMPHVPFASNLPRTFYTEKQPRVTRCHEYTKNDLSNSFWPSISGHRWEKKMAQKSEKDAVSLSARFAELNKFAQNQEFSKALKVANRSKFYGKIFHLITMGRINLNFLVETICLFNY